MKILRWFIIALILMAIAIPLQAQTDARFRDAFIFRKLEGRGGIPLFWDGFIFQQYAGTTRDVWFANYVGSGHFIVRLQGDGSDVFTIDKSGNVVTVGSISAASLGLLDTDASNTLSLVWNENDTSDRILNFLVGAGTRSLTFNENFTIGNGFDFSLTAEDATGSILLDNITVEFENGFATQRLFKLIQGTDAAATLTVEGGSGVIDQDLTTDSTPTLGAQLTLNGADPAVIFDGSTASDTDFWIGVTADEGGDDNDFLQFGDGTTKGTNPFWTMDTDGDMGFGVASIADTSQYEFVLAATKNIRIDGRTNPRNMTEGVMRFLHTPAITDTRVIHFDVDANGMADTNVVFVALKATGISAGEAVMGWEITLDKANSTGGAMEGLRVGTAGAGSAEAHALHVDPGVVVIHQEAGSFSNIEQAWDEDGGFADTTVAFRTDGTDVAIFSDLDDKVYVGNAADFNAIQVSLLTEASGAGVKPKFEFSIAGPGWTPFVPNDGTNGFRASGTIAWTEGSLSGWTAVSVSGASKKYIRITREQVGLGTSPVEKLIQTLLSVEYKWDENGDLDVREVIHTNEKFIDASDFAPEGDGSNNATVEHDRVDPTNRWPFERTTGISDTQDMDWYALKGVLQTPTSLTLWTRASDFANCVVTMTIVVQAAGTPDATGAVVITPTGDDTWEEFTYTFTSSYSNDDELFIKIAVTSLDTGDTVDFTRCKLNF